MRRLARGVVVTALAALLLPAVPTLADEAAAANPCAAADDLAALFATPEPIVTAEVASSPDELFAEHRALRKTCKCSCGRQPCTTSADCGGGFCGFGITCC